MSCRLFGCTHVYFSSFLLHSLSELLPPIVLDLVQQTLHPLRLQGSEDIVDRQLRRLLTEVHVGAVPAGVFGVFLPRIVLRLPPVQFLPTENISQTQLKIFLPSDRNNNGRGPARFHLRNNRNPPPPSFLACTNNLL